MSDPNNPQNIPDEVAALVQTLGNLAEALLTTEEALGSVPAEGAIASAAAAAAIVSQGQASTSATNAAAAATATGVSAAAALVSANAAAAKLSAASTSAGQASASATTAAGSVTGAASSAATAGASKLSASNAATHAAALKQVQPSMGVAGADGETANATYSTAATFTAPCNGYVYALSSLNVASLTNSDYTMALSINGNLMAADSVQQSQRQMGVLQVTAGTVVDALLVVTTNPTPPGAAATLRVLAFFVPSAT